MDTLTVADLRKSYPGGKQVLRGLTFSLPPGSFWGFVGANGAGKTTTIRILAGLMQPDEGSVVFQGRPITGIETEYKRQCGFVLDEPTYVPWMSAREFLRFAGIMFTLTARESLRRTDELLEYLDLTASADAPIATYSTGMKKKVSVAAAMLHAPRLIILDEPLEGVDAISARQIKDALQLMVRGGATVLMSSHALEMLEAVCSDVLILHEGTAAVQGPMTSVAGERPAHLPGATHGLEQVFLSTIRASTVHTPLSFL